jgi:hypothetical protein
MIDLQNAFVNTAGAYVRIDEHYLFTIGIRPYQGRIPVVRLGGHREGQETGWQCADREVLEEAALKITPIDSSNTYLADGDQAYPDLMEIDWHDLSDPEHTPLLVVSYHRDGKERLSLMYLARAQGVPRPSAEVKGLLLLKPEDIAVLCNQAVTLEEYLEGGGQAILNGSFDKNMILEPFIQLRLLSKILRK